MRATSILQALLATSFFAAAAHAGQPGILPSEGSPNDVQAPRVVIELFTSQGCSSCPPADALLKTYGADPRVIALTLPIDYWDYIGWKDTLASPRNSERQRAYAKARGDGAVYTPQAVINGTFHVNGAVKSEIEHAIDLTSSAASPSVPIRFWQERNTLNIAAAAAPANQPVKEATVWLAVVQQSGTVRIDRGENAGRTIEYTNVVREMTPVGLWKGQPLLIQIPRAAVMLAETQKSVVFIQEGKAGPIIGAAWAGLW